MEIRFLTLSARCSDATGPSALACSKPSRFNSIRALILTKLAVESSILRELSRSQCGVRTFALPPAHNCKIGDGGQRRSACASGMTYVTRSSIKRMYDVLRGEEVRWLLSPRSFRSPIRIRRSYGPVLAGLPTPSLNLECESEACPWGAIIDLSRERCAQKAAPDLRGGISCLHTAQFSPAPKRFAKGQRQQQHVRTSRCRCRYRITSRVPARCRIKDALHQPQSPGLT